jgi:hypothetical protein
MVDYIMMDAEAPMPYVRRATGAKEELTFSYDQQAKSVKQVVTTPPKRAVYEADGTTLKEYVQDADTTSTETSTMLRTTKVMLLTYGGTSNEDAETFFQAFERLPTELGTVWQAAAAAKNKDATILFNAMGKMLTETANTDWHGVLADTTTVPDKTWESFKKAVAHFVMTKVLDSDSYDKERTYLMERHKPKRMTARQWWLRLQQLNHYLVYMFKTLDDLKVEVDGAQWNHWWQSGELSAAELKRIIIHKAPGPWQRQLRLHSVQHTKSLSVEEIVGYYTTLEAMEESNRRPTIPGPRGRGRRNYYDRNGHDRYGRGAQSNNSGHGPQRNDRYGQGSYSRDNNNNNRAQDYNRNNNMNSPGRGERNFAGRQQNRGGRGPSRFAGQRTTGPPPRQQQEQNYRADEEETQEITEEQAYQVWNNQWEEPEENQEEKESEEEEDSYDEDAYYGVSYG